MTSHGTHRLKSTRISTKVFCNQNGRSARMIEKWFIAEKLGKKAWYIQSEKMYYQHHHAYFNNIRALGLEYIALDYNRSLPFALMLPYTIINNDENLNIH